MSDPMDKITRLAKRLQEKAAEIGLDLATFAVVPDLDGGPSVIQGVFVIDLPGKEEEHEDSEGFADVLAGVLQATEEAEEARKKEEEQNKLEAMKARLLEVSENLSDKGGFLE